MALIPPFFLDCIVAIGLLGGDGTKLWVASGFLYGDFTEKKSETESYYKVFLITNRHVFKDKEKVFVRFNPEGNESARELELLLIENGKQQWIPHPDPNVDIAIVPLDAQALKEMHVRFNWFHSDKHVMNLKMANESGLSEGDGVYVLGFPMGLTGGQRNYVIARQGIFARLRDALSGASKEFLVDTTIFPGNSGGPVVTKPEIVAIEGTKSQSAAHLIGVVQGYLPYQDVAISPQTGKTRVLFEENSGLAAVIPIDFVQEAVSEFWKTAKKKEASVEPRSLTKSSGD